MEPNVNVLGPRASDAMTHARRRDVRRAAEPVFRPTVAKALSGLSRPEFDALVARRRAARAFPVRPVPQDLLLEVCRAAAEAAQAMAVGPEPLRWLVFADRVSGLERAVHTYQDGAFTPLAQLPGEEARYLSMPPTFMSAPVVLTPLTDLGRRLAEEAADGYFNSLTRTGYSLHTAWLTAVSVGLSGCLFRGSSPPLLHTLAGRGGLDSRPFLSLALGCAAEDTAEGSRG
ncbi:nitroreductase family protein [Streptomyces sp. NPDC059629]|uniref:nitroreductase family protein n=1 Tax=Streptomyces sp. NPDC059629 TaxID=3346889 RepID=UPI0036CF3103